jgi:2-dehydro-3-deoxyphosphogluconate aldolase/(4S)-4-hydroxy-2-oxoglutarate aldolase
MPLRCLEIRRQPADNAFMPTPPPSRDELLAGITSCGVVAVIRAASTESLLDVARALLAGGVTNIEVTMTTPGALAGIWALGERFAREGAMIGVGTVMDVQTVRQAADAGAAYVVSPHFDPEIVAATRELGRVSIPGAFTPTEFLRAAAGGADVVKVFPSAAVGPNYFRDVLAPLPHLKLMPTGGVTPTNAGEWLRAGAVCVGAGASLMPKEAVAKKDWKLITDNARTMVESVRQARAARH